MKTLEFLNNLFTTNGYELINELHTSDNVTLLSIRKVKAITSLNIIIRGNTVSILDPYKEKDYHLGKVSLYDPKSIDNLLKVISDSYTLRQTECPQI